MSVSTAAHWVAHARGQRLDRVQFASRKPGRASNRTPAAMERRVLKVRQELRERSVLGEHGPDAIRRVLQQSLGSAACPARSTVHRILVRHGVLDGARRQRRPAPPKGWYLPNLASANAELDAFDFIEDLKIADGPLVSVLTGTSLHGALVDAWIRERPNAQNTLATLLQRWRLDGLPTYAQFDNDTIFQGAHQWADTVGRISRLCLALQIIPVFAPPREPGFQNAIESFNALWQSKVWQRHRFANLADLSDVSARYIAAYRTKTVARREAAPQRRSFPTHFALDLSAPLRGTMIFLRRTDDIGNTNFLGRSFVVDRQWAHRLVRCEVDFTHDLIRFYALRRREPQAQPLLRELPYLRPHKPFQGQP